MSLAGCDPSAAARKKAVEATTDQTQLAAIAAEDKDEGVRHAAIVRLTDQTLLARIAAEGKNGYIRFPAVTERRHRKRGVTCREFQERRGILAQGVRRKIIAA